MRFSGYGFIALIRMEDYLAGQWETSCKAIGEDGRVYRIVFVEQDGECQYRCVRIRRA